MIESNYEPMTHFFNRQPLHFALLALLLLMVWALGRAGEKKNPHCLGGSGDFLGGALVDSARNQPSEYAQRDQPDQSVVSQRFDERLEVPDYVESNECKVASKNNLENDRQSGKQRSDLDQFL